MILYLASKSPRRRQLLEQLGVAFQVLDVDIPEVPAPGEVPSDYVRRLALGKAEAGLTALASAPAPAPALASAPAPAQAPDGDAWVLGSDTEVVLDGEVFGKPADAEDAAAMLRRLSGREHEVLTAVCLAGPGGREVAVCATRVRFAELDAARIAAYVASGEPFGKAGAYAIQGRAGGFISHLDGSHSAVMGLPLYETAQLLRWAGFAV